MIISLAGNYKELLLSSINPNEILANPLVVNNFLFFC